MRQFSGSISMTFEPMTDRQYSTACKYWAEEDHAIKHEEKWTGYLVEACRRSITHADPSHLAKLLKASRLWNKYRMTARILKAMQLPWAWHHLEEQSADVPKANKRLLADLRINWEIKLFQLVDQEDKHQQERPFDFEKAFEHLVNKAIKRGYDSAKIVSIVERIEEAKMLKVA